MESIKLSITGNVAKTISKPHHITAGTIGLPVEFTFDETWDGLKKWAVFRAGSTEISVEDPEANAVVPSEVLVWPGVWLSIGVYGVNNDGTIAIPTIWANIRPISPGVIPSEDPAANPSPSVWQKVITYLTNIVGKLFVKTVNGIPPDENGNVDISTGTASENAVLFVEQTLDNDQQAQAKRNIGATYYYSTAREELPIPHEDLNSEYVFGLYDSLMAAHPDKVQKNEIHNNDGSFTNFEYVISTGDHNEEGKGIRPWRDLDIKKPKYLILSGIHGTERPAVIAAYRFVRDLLSGKSAIAPLLDGAIIHIMPIGTPHGFDSFSYLNANGENINQNFTATNPEKETQAISNWIKSNSDADLFIDCHNQGAVNEVAIVISATEDDSDSTHTAKKIAMRGLDRIIPYWRDVIGYSKQLLCADENNPEGVMKDVVFSYSLSANFPKSSCRYAENHGITSFFLEMSVYQNGSYFDFEKDQKVCTPETVAAGAEGIGNILVETYTEAITGGFAEDMKSIDSKLDMLLGEMSSGFKIESGVLEVPVTVGSNEKPHDLVIPCSDGAKTVLIRADDATYSDITSKASQNSECYWFVGAMGNSIKTVGKLDNRGLMYRMEEVTVGSTKYWQPIATDCKCGNGNQYSITTFGVKKGFYNWTAYYWNE